jgi:DNA-binding CsgD family transcriptional regulator
MVARRLMAESVFLVLAVRETAEGHPFPGVAELAVGGLAEDDARGLLADATPRALDERVRDRLVAETGGNPLALLELVRAMSDAELSGGFAHPPITLTPGLLEQHYLEKVLSLPGPTRQLLTLAAADATGDATLLWRAAQVLGLGHDALEPARAEGLLEIGSGVRFRHPLVRSAAYAAGSPEDRRAAHRALAEVTDAESDSDRRVWHLAAAADAPDEDLAGQLERSAERAQAHAGLAAAAAFLQRSVALTPESARRADRALAAAQAHLHAGAYDAGRAVLAEAEADAVDDLQRARVEQLRAEIDRASTSGSHAPQLLLNAARRLESLDPELARQTYLDAWAAAVVAAGQAAPGGQLVQVCAAARRVCAEPEAASGTQPRDYLIRGLVTLVLESPERAAPNLRRAVAAYLEDDPATEEWLHWGVLVGNSALVLWDFDAWDAATKRHVEVARQSGALAALAAALNVRRVVAMWRGDFDTARSLAVTEDGVKQLTGTRRASYGGLFLAAYEGRPERAIPLIAATADEARARGEGLGLMVADRALALLHLGLGRYAEAAAAASRATEGSYDPFTSHALPELAEAAARSGQPELANEALHRLQVAAAVGGSDWVDGLVARTRGLVSEGPAAEAAYAEAVTRLGRTPLRIELARAHLVFGEWLRREGRRLDAREHLHLAHALFIDIGAEAFAERARRELVGTGEKVRKREVDTLNELTAQEEQIARLARDGRTNPEIAAELFISARTVEWHLRKVFAKLGIVSRKGLREALGAQRAPSAHY